jgi:hypothetical protein
VDELNAHLAAIPPPDDLGLQWLISELEGAEHRGSLLVVPGRALDDRSTTAHDPGMARGARAPPEPRPTTKHGANSVSTLSSDEQRVLLRCGHLSPAEQRRVLVAFRFPDAVFADALGSVWALPSRELRLLVRVLDGQVRIGGESLLDGENITVCRELRRC